MIGACKKTREWRGGRNGVEGIPCILIFMRLYVCIKGFPMAQQDRILLLMQETGLDPWSRKIPWRRKWQPTPVCLPEKFHGQRSLVGYSPCGCRVRHNLAIKQQHTNYLTLGVRLQILGFLRQNRLFLHIFCCCWGLILSILKHLRSRIWVFNM